MALNKAALKTAIENGVKAIDLTNPQTDVPSAIAQVIADAIDVYVKAGTVTVTVSTTGTAAAQTGTGTGSIS